MRARANHAVTDRSEDITPLHGIPLHRDERPTEELDLAVVVAIEANAPPPRPVRWRWARELVASACFAVARRWDRLGAWVEP